MKRKHLLFLFVVIAIAMLSFPSCSNGDEIVTSEVDGVEVQVPASVVESYGKITSILVTVHDERRQATVKETEKVVDYMNNDISGKMAERMDTDYKLAEDYLEYYGNFERCLGVLNRIWVDVEKIESGTHLKQYPYESVEQYYEYINSAEAYDYERNCIRFLETEYGVDFAGLL